MRILCHRCHVTAPVRAHMWYPVPPRLPTRHRRNVASEGKPENQWTRTIPNALSPKATTKRGNATRYVFYSTFDSATNQRLIVAAGLQIERTCEETADEDGTPVPFLWVVARKPASDGAA